MLFRSNDTATTEIYTRYNTLSLHDALPIAEGIKRAGSDDPVKVAQALKSGQPVDTLLGPIAFDAKGDVKDPHFDINQWHDGKYAPIAQ